MRIKKLTNGLLSILHAERRTGDFDCLERLAVNVGQLSWKPLKVDTEDPELKTTKMKISNLPLQRLKRV